ncbi:MAG: hypothetical protein Q9227_004315 [Pyrenula ochraceoflavens]
MPRSVEASSFLTTQIDGFYNVYFGSCKKSDTAPTSDPLSESPQSIVTTEAGTVQQWKPQDMRPDYTCHQINITSDDAGREEVPQGMIQRVVEVTVESSPLDRDGLW